MDITEKRLMKIRNVVDRRQSGLTVVLQDIHDPHNAGAIFRTCDAFGVQTVYLIFEKEMPFNPKKIGKKSSSTANKWLDFEVFESTRKCFLQLKKQGFKIISTFLSKDTKNIFGIDLKDKKIALIVGNEQRGLTQEAVDLSDEVLSIPMAGMVQSMNVSVTIGIFIYEVIRQRKKFGNSFRLRMEARKSLEKKFVDK
ncbi:RNA methyltransferase [Candidatus Dojkabacteria bacterium]|nr:RNA methyltransferase [Candidatus Dojkabacteria bacterium]